MTYGAAGQWGPEAILSYSGSNLSPLALISITVKTAAGATATLYTTRTAAVTASNPVSTDSAGNLTFFAAPGAYTLNYTGAGGPVVVPVTVNLDPADLSPDVFGSSTYLAQIGPSDPAVRLGDPPLVQGTQTLALASAFGTLQTARLNVYDSTGIAPSEYGFQPTSDSAYNAVWTRDLAMALRHQPHLLSATKRRQFVTHRLAQRSTTADADPDGGFLPANWIADRISSTGVRTFKNAGGGKLPFMDGIHFVLLALWTDWKVTGDNSTFLAQRTVIDTCLAVLPLDPGGSGCVYSAPATPSVDFGFTDAVLKTGNVAYGTALLAQSYKMLAEMAGETGSGTYTTAYKTAVTGLRTLRLASGWYAGSSLNNVAVNDVWATALIVAEGLCSRAEQYASAVTIAQAYQAGTITQNGGVRHLTGSQAWTGTSTTFGTYQNGGYWFTPLYDCLRAVALVNPDLAYLWAQEACRQWSAQATAYGNTLAPLEWFNGASIGNKGEAEGAAMFARITSPTTSLRVATATTATVSDAFATDTSANYTKSGFTYNGTDHAMQSSVTTDGAYFVNNALSTADAGCTITARTTSFSAWPAVILRWADANNYIFCSLGNAGLNALFIYDVVGGVITQKGTVSIPVSNTAFQLNTYYELSAWVVGTTVSFSAFGTTLTATTAVTAAGKVGARHGTTGSGVTEVNSIYGWTLPATTVPADLVVAHDGGLILAGASSKTVALGAFRVLDAKGRLIQSRDGTTPLSIV